jgi:hypothetical protein
MDVAAGLAAGSRLAQSSSGFDQFATAVRFTAEANLDVHPDQPNLTIDVRV